MNSHKKSHNTLHLITISIIILMFILSACDLFQQSASAIEVDSFEETVENYTQAEVIFQVKLPAPISSNEKLMLEILDDVTGMYFNPAQYELTAQDEQNYSIRITLTVGERIKYRFLRKGSESVYEYTPQNMPVRYRVLLVNGPLLIQDLVSAWSGYPYSGPVGRIRGQLLDSKTNAPIPNMAIYAAGMQTLSAADGTFIIENLPVWTQNIVISSLDGSYETFQQGALIAEEATTPIFISLNKRKMVDINFEVKTPEGFNTDLPLRLASNQYSLGYPETELPTGSSMASSNLPIFTKTTQNLYSLKLSLPAGADIRYKFTFGDGFWNAELTNIGNFVTRELIIPSTNTTIRKKIEMMKSPGVGEITINLTTPDSTPVSDQVSLQLNPFGWMQSLPMVQTGENQWSYILYTPTHLLGNTEYRFCRNDQCGNAISEPIQDSIFTGTSTPQTLTVNLEKWQYLADAAEPSDVDTNGGVMQPRLDFIAGFELISEFPASWKSSIDQGLLTIFNTGANWVVLSPTWSLTSTNPPLLEPVPGIDLLWPDLLDLITGIKTNNLQPVLFPQLSDSVPIDQFWSNATKDAGWWQSLFDRYQRFVLQNADLASVMNSSAIMVGDPGMRPAMSFGTLSNGDPSNPPENADEQWSQLIRDIRARYSGPVIGVISIPDLNAILPGWLKDVDAIYVLFSPSLTDSGDQSVEGLKNVFGAALDSLIQPFATQYNKPIILGINYPAAQLAINGCSAINDSCLSYDSNVLKNSNVDLELQQKIYNAAIIVSAERPWINGFISREFNPLVAVQDQSSSIYGKPALDVLWFWYHFILNKPSS